MKKIASFLPVLLLLSTLKAQTPITIDPTLPPTGSCNFKIGYRLIFQDEFNSFNSDSWDISSPGDDQPNYGQDGFCEEPYKTVVNASNSFVSNGELHLRVREGEDMNACDFSGGEVKTFNNYPGGMRHWKMYSNSYLEARIKVAYFRGTASSFWLYGSVAGTPGNGRFFEIDMFETGYLDETKLGANLHYGHSYETSHYTDPKSFVFRDEEGDDVNLHEQFLTYGIELTDSQMKMYLNGVQYAVYNFAPLIPNNPISYFKHHFLLIFALEKVPLLFPETLPIVTICRKTC